VILDKEKRLQKKLIAKKSLSVEESSFPKMVSVGSFETVVNLCQATPCDIPQDGILQFGFRLCCSTFCVYELNLLMNIRFSRKYPPGLEQMAFTNMDFHLQCHLDHRVYLIFATYF